MSFLDCVTCLRFESRHVMVGDSDTSIWACACACMLVRGRDLVCRCFPLTALIHHLVIFAFVLEGRLTWSPFDYSDEYLFYRERL